MTTRERWIVYPLLFLAIGLGLRSGLILQEMERRELAEYNRIQAKTIHAQGGRIDQLVCSQLVCSSVTVLGPNNKPVVMMAADSQTHDGAIETFSAAGLQQTLLKSTGQGGSLALFTPDAKHWLLFRPGGTDQLIPAPVKKSSAPQKDTKAKDAKSPEDSKDDEAWKPDKADASTPESK